MPTTSNTPRRISLITKFIFVISLSLVLTFGLFVIAAYYTGVEILRHFDQYRTVEMASVIEGEIAMSMGEGDPGHLGHILDGTQKAPSVESVVLLRADSSVIRISGGSHVSDVPMDLLARTIKGKRTRSTSISEGDNDFLFVMMPLERKVECSVCHGEGEEPIAYLGVKTVTTTFAEITRGHRNSNILTTLVVFLVVGFVVSIAVLLIVVRPIRRFSRALDRRSAAVRTDSEQKDLPPMIPLEADSEEIVHMIDRFNDLLQSLNEARKDLHTSHRKELETAKRLSQIGELAAHTAHDIKNPLAGIRESLKTISSRLSEEGGHREILSRAIAELERIYSLILTLLSKTRSRDPRFDVVGLNAVVADVVRVATREAEQRDVHLVIDLDPELSPIEADEEMLRQIIWNLISNALDVSSAGKSVHVTTRRSVGSSESAVLLVRDEGPGIDPDKQEEIFKPFVTTKEDGTGLGLPAVRRCVEAHGGSIDVRSTPGKGSVFSVTIPLSVRIRSAVGDQS